MSKRSTTFGMGKRPEYVLNQASPAKTSFKAPSDFDYDPAKGGLFSLGGTKGPRELFKDLKGPGPGAYEVRNTFGRGSLKCSIAPKCSVPGYSASSNLRR